MSQMFKNYRELLPVQRCIAGESVDRLSDGDLLSVIIGTGIRGASVLDLSSGLLSDFGGISGLYRAGLRELAGKHGIGLNKAVRIHAALELGRRLLVSQNCTAVVDSPEKVWKLLQPEMGILSREEFRVLVLNNKNHILKNSVVSMGTVSEALVHPREIFRDAIRESGASIIIAHNHPSGVLVPSREDIASTKRIKEAGFIIGIELLDHVIISQGAYLSLKEAGYL